VHSRVRRTLPDRGTRTSLVAALIVPNARRCPKVARPLGRLSEPSIAMRTARFWARGCELPAVRRADRLVAALRDGGADEA